MRKFLRGFCEMKIFYEHCFRYIVDNDKKPE